MKKLDLYLIIIGLILIASVLYYIGERESAFLVGGIALNEVRQILSFNDFKERQNKKEIINIESGK